MTEPIVNRMSGSKLVTIDPEDFYPEGPRTAIDLKDWLYEGMVLREKDFRERVRLHAWSAYRGHFVALYCSTDAIVPSWAYMLITSRLVPYARRVAAGNPEQLETLIYGEALRDIDFSEYEAKPVVIKGCSGRLVPEGAYTLLTQKLQPHVKSLMYGEACAAVPVFKQSK